MSFILDALKKSEAERQRQSAPGLMNAGMAPRRRGLPAWAIAICLLLLVNALVLAFMLIRQPAPAPAAPAHASGTTAAAAASPEAAHFSPMDSAPVYAPEIPVDETNGGAVGKAPAVSGKPREHKDPALDRDAQDDEVLPEISELNLTGDQTLPDLHLDVHVYATNPADRFVYINMRKYREGAEVQDGLALERIRRDGVVMNYHGLRFLLPRQ